MTTWATVDPTTELRERYHARGWWDDRTLPALLQDALSRSGSTTFRIHSLDCPWTGTLDQVSAWPVGWQVVYRGWVFGQATPSRSRSELR